MTKFGTEKILCEKAFREDTIRLLGENAAAVIHELRAPLAGIYAQIQLLESKLEQIGYTQEANRFDLIYREISQISLLCDQIMALASGKVCDFHLTDPVLICEDSASLLRALAIAHNVQLTLELEEGCPFIMADELQLRRLIINLVANAVQILAEHAHGGRVLVSMNNMDSMLCIMVKDNGPGIPQENLQKVFEPYFTTRNGGSGMGLYISRQIAKMHQGELIVNSKPGCGAVFMLTLPINI